MMAESTTTTTTVGRAAVPLQSATQKTLTTTMTMEAQS
jgi:hypothetical protein